MTSGVDAPSLDRVEAVEVILDIGAEGGSLTIVGMRRRGWLALPSRQGRVNPSPASQCRGPRGTGILGKPLANMNTAGEDASQGARAAAGMSSAGILAAFHCLI
jgi:hypothetical protein